MSETYCTGNLNVMHVHLTAFLKKLGSSVKFLSVCVSAEEEFKSLKFLFMTNHLSYCNWHFVLHIFS